MPHIEISNKDIEAIKSFIPEFKRTMVNVYPFIPPPYSLIAPVVVSLVSLAVLQVIENIQDESGETKAKQTNTMKHGKDIINKATNPGAYTNLRPNEQDKLNNAYPQPLYNFVPAPIFVV